jgi:general secretion pathway protein I
MTQFERQSETGLTGHANRRRRRRRSGLSLLEVILSIAILGGAMVVIGHLFNLGYRSALQVRIRSDANLLCDSKMAELAAGVLPAKSTGNQQIPESPGWNYSIDMQPSQQPGLLIATVTVEQNAEVSATPTSMSIVRFLPDPDYDPDEER